MQKVDICTYYLPEIIPDSHNKLKKGFISHLSLRPDCTCYHPDTVRMNKMNLKCEGKKYCPECLLTENDMSDDFEITLGSESLKMK